MLYSLNDIQVMIHPHPSLQSDLGMNEQYGNDRPCETIFYCANV